MFNRRDDGGSVLVEDFCEEKAMKVKLVGELSLGEGLLFFFFSPLTTRLKGREVYNLMLEDLHKVLSRERKKPYHFFD